MYRYLAVVGRPGSNNVYVTRWKSVETGLATNLSTLLCYQSFIYTAIVETQVELTLF